MKTNRTIKRLLFAATFLVAGLVGANAQSSTIPTNFKPDGTDSKDATPASEAIDTVAVGATMKYWVEPNGATSSSTWSWTTSEDVAGAGTATVTPDASPYQNPSIKFTTLGTGKINAKVTTDCQDPNGTTVKYQVIKLPTADLTSTTVTVTNCFSSVDIPVTYTTDVSNLTGTASVTMMYELYNSKSATPAVPVNTGSVTLPKGATSPKITLSPSDFKVGTYPIPSTGATLTVKLIQVDDHISTKCSLHGTITTATCAITVSPTPTTGRIYHIPNN